MTIHSGVYLVGKNGDYADLETALADITSLTGDIDLIQISPYSIPAGTTHDIDLNGYRLRITSALPHKGKGAVGWETNISDSYGTAASIVIRLGGILKGTVRVEHQNWIRSGSPTGSVDMLRFDQDATDLPPAFLEIANCIFDGRSIATVNGLSTNSKFDVKLWNSMLLNFPGTSRWGAKIGLAAYSASQPTAYVDNCLFINCRHGLYVRQPTRVTNSIAFNCLSAGFYLEPPPTSDSIAASNANISDDASALGFGGELNRQDAAIVSEFQSIDPLSKLFAIPYDDSYLLREGVPPIIADNSTGVEGNARPGSDNAYSIGPYEAQEKLRQAWTAQRKVTIDGSKIAVTGTAVPMCLTNLTPGMLEVLAASSSEDGGDIRITTDRWGWEQIPIEVAQWDKANEKCMVWFRPTAVVAGVDLSLYVWFGNPNAACLPLDNDKGQWKVWEDFTLVLHCMEDPNGVGWIKDSSPARHYGVFSGVAADTWNAGLSLSGVGKSYKLESGRRILLPNGNYVNDAAGMTLHSWMHRSTTPTAGIAHCMFHLERDSAAARLLLRVEYIPGIGIVRKLNGYMPDSASQTSVSPAGLVPGASQLGVSMFNGSPTDNMRHFLDGAQDGYDVEFISGNFSNTDSIDAAVGARWNGSDPLEGSMQEVWLYKGTGRDSAAYFATWYAMIENAASFFKTPSFVGQEGSRDLRFVTEDGEVALQATDYYITFDNANDGTLLITLNGVWEAIGADQAWGLDRRLAVESRLRELAKMQGTRGRLVIGPTQPQTIEDIVLQSVTVEAVDNNAGIIYALQFGVAQTAALARALVFNGQRVQASNFFVEYGAVDRTQFKVVFRASPIRIESGPPLKTIRVTSMLALTGTARGHVAARRRVEAFIKDWAFQRLGTEGELTIDDVSEGACHLADVSPSNMTYPDRVGLDMVFITGYGS